MASSDLSITTSGKVFALGDIHGDLDRAQNLLRGMGLIDIQNQWIGSDSTLVQTGDLIDRGEQDRETIDFFEELKIQAKKSGGRVITIIANHEVRNSIGKLLKLPIEAMYSFKEFNVPTDYINEKCYKQYLKEKKKYINSAHSDYQAIVEKKVEEKEKAGMLGRLHVFCPGGKYAKILSNWPMVAIVNDSIFMHGGLREEYSSIGRQGIQRLNEELSLWFQGKDFKPSIHKDFEEDFIRGDETPFDSRYFARENDKSKCKELKKILKDLDVKRMVVGHTIQLQGINEDCDGSVVRIDVGMSRGFLTQGSWIIPKKLQAIEIKNEIVNIISVEDQFHGVEAFAKAEREIKESTFDCKKYSSKNLPYFRCPHDFASKTWKEILKNDSGNVRVFFRKEKIQQDSYSCFFEALGFYMQAFPTISGTINNEVDFCSSIIN